MNTLSPMRSQPSVLDRASPRKLSLEQLASAHVGGKHLRRLDLLRAARGDVAIEDDEICQHARRDLSQLSLPHAAALPAV